MDRNGPEANSGRPPPATDGTTACKKVASGSPATEGEIGGPRSGGSTIHCHGPQLSLSLPACLPVPREHGCSAGWKLGEPHPARCCRDSMEHDWSLSGNGARCRAAATLWAVSSGSKCRPARGTGKISTQNGATNFRSPFLFFFFFTTTTTFP